MWDEDDGVGAEPGLGGGVGKAEEDGTAESWQVESPPISISDPIANSSGRSTDGRVESKENMVIGERSPTGSIFITKRGQPLWPFVEV